MVERKGSSGWNEASKVGRVLKFTFGGYSVSGELVELDDWIAVSATIGSGRTTRSGTTVIRGASSSRATSCTNWLWLTFVENRGGGGIIKSSGRTTLELVSPNSIFVGRFRISIELLPWHASLVVGGSGAALSCVPCVKIPGLGRSFVDNGRCVSWGSEMKLTRFVCGLRGTCGFGLMGGGSTGVPSEALSAAGGGGVFTFCWVNTASGDGGAASGLDDYPKPTQYTSVLCHITCVLIVMSCMYLYFLKLSRG